jgi:hypothetical protein
MKGAVRIANISGFYGDRLAAAREMLDGPDRIDVLTGDYLAELTMLILWKARRKDPSLGYAATFVRQMEQTLGTCLERGIRVVSNAGGLNPHGLADKLREVSAGLGLSPRIAVVEGDDVLESLELDEKPLTANAYLGGFGISAALAAGADVVVTPRVTDAALVVGPAAWWHGWTPDDLDALAGAVVAGHIIECGPQATGGNYSFAAEEVPDHRYPGFPIAEVSEDGSSIITKQPGTGGAVTIGTVTSQLLYEIAEPAYANPDVVARFDTITLTQEAPDRVRISGVRGEPPSDQLKVALNFVGGWRNTMTLVLTGLDVEYKADRAASMLGEVLGGWEQFESHDIRLVGDHLRITVKDPEPNKVGRRFSNAVMELLLASYAGAYTTTPPTDASEYGVYKPAFIPASKVEHAVVLPDGERVVIPHPTTTTSSRSLSPMPQPTSPTRQRTWEGTTERMPLGMICGGRSGDKGGNANVGLWTRTDEAYKWLAQTLTVDAFKELVPEAKDLDVQRHELPNLRALNFVVVGILGEGVASSVRPDPQAKGLAEYVRAQLVDVPASVKNHSSAT